MKLIRSVCFLSRVCGGISMVLLVSSVFVVCHLIVVRYGLEQSAIWQHEFVTYSLIGACFIGSPYVLYLRGHVQVDLVLLYLKGRPRVGLQIFSSLLVVGFCAIVLWEAWPWWLEAWQKNWHGETVWKPVLWIPWLVFPLGFSVLIAQAVVDVLSLVTTGRLPGPSPHEQHNLQGGPQA